MLLAKLVTGEEIHRYQKSIVVNFTGGRKVLSTSPANGGLRGDLRAVFNNDCVVGTGMGAAMKAPTYAEHNDVLSRELGLDPEKTAGIGTAAQMENVSIQTETYKDMTVTAAVTGGVEMNGGRAGDPASWDEFEQEIQTATAPHGTINILLFISVNLTDGALARALVTCTEAKTSALQELAAPSRYSRGLATGSGTDGAIIVCNSESPITLSDAGKHVKLGELIGKTVKRALKEALRLQTGLSPETQHDVLKRVSRFGITAQSLWQDLGEPEPAGLRKARYAELLETRMQEGKLVAGASLYAHLLDQLDWGLLRIEEAAEYAGALLKQMGMGELDGEAPPQTEEAIAFFIGALKTGLMQLMQNELSKY
ncbi:MAG: adenosylcobinamide amidohydrolase [Clostridiales bacterium]|nr:adenosylcobinamide amidohydrolase [Clostridiales bacterium]